MNLTFFVIIGLCVFAVAVHGQKEPRKVLVPFIYKAEAFLDLDENAKIMYTSGLVDGFLASSLFGASDETVTDVKACLKNMDTTQLAAIFTKYVKENPEGWQNPMSVLGFNALVGTCPGVIKITWIRDEETRATSSRRAARPAGNGCSRWRTSWMTWPKMCSRPHLIGYQTILGARTRPHGFQLSVEQPVARIAQPTG
jgi:hypothetical protein